jgi:integrase
MAALMNSRTWIQAWLRYGARPSPDRLLPPPGPNEPAPELPQLDPATVVRELDEFSRYLVEEQPSLFRQLVSARAEYDRQRDLASNPPAPPAVTEDEQREVPAHDMATPAEIEALIAAAHPVMRLVIRLLMSSDFSREEIRLLRWADIDEAAGTVRVSRGRLARLTEPLRAELAQIGRHPGSPYVLPLQFGEARPIDRQQAEHLWFQARKDSGATWRRLPRPSAAEQDTGGPSDGDQ